VFGSNLLKEYLNILKVWKIIVLTSQEMEQYEILFDTDYNDDRDIRKSNFNFLIMIGRTMKN